MLSYINNLLQTWGIDSTISSELAYLIAAFSVIILSIISNFLAKGVLLKVLKAVITRTKSTWDDILLEKRVFTKLSHIVPSLVIYGFAGIFNPYSGTIERLSLVYMIVIGIIVIISLLSSVEDIYGTYEVSKQRPIKGYLQVVKLFVIVIGVIIVVGTVINKSPWKILTGIGAMTALIMLVFKDSILALVGSIQLSANDMVRIGDWIQVDKYNADGDVIDISLNTVKVQNFDKTITTIPTYSLVSESFKNWRGMVESGGRRIKRSINIDMTSVAFCTDEMLGKYEKIDLLKSYIQEKKEELELYNDENKIDTTVPVNGRRLTNIGTFRSYLLAYIKNHPKLEKDMTIIIRQLPPSEKGLPIEIYMFSNDTAWSNYEDIQSDIFDHILAVVPEFGLRVFQNPTGSDIRDLAGKGTGS